MTARRNQLQYLVTVAEEGQITSAARKLHLAQPALSQAIASLESELGIELLTRHPRGVTLTPAGEAFLVKARAALRAETEAAVTAQSLARAARNMLSVGFIGPPPEISTPELLESFARERPDAQVGYHDLAFPTLPTAAWLAEVDVALCHAPRMEDGLRAHPVRVEPRVAVLGRDHPLAGRGELRVADVLDETFVSYHPDVQSEWAGFHSLDDHRGHPPDRLTEDRVFTTLQMLSAMNTGHAATVLPAADANLALQVLVKVVALPIVDAAPARICLVWREDVRNPLVDALVRVARRGIGVPGGV
jgi:DNA-binding transcriptional LysR family regulator